MIVKVTDVATHSEAVKNMHNMLDLEEITGESTLLTLIQSMAIGAFSHQIPNLPEPDRTNVRKLNSDLEKRQHAVISAKLARLTRS
jgi:hypothetical protein